MLKILIIEDELPAQLFLIRKLNSVADDIVIVGRIDSVEDAIKWFNDPENSADIVFMDVELSDGSCFEIFERSTVDANVVITTAYDQYAIEAFKAGSIDYILKPFTTDELSEAIERCRRRLTPPIYNSKSIKEAAKVTYKKRFAVKVGDKILIINIQDVSYFYSEDKTTFLITHQNQRYIIDQSLDNLIKILDPHDFFRLSRAYIGSIRSIKTISKHFSSRLKITLTPATKNDIFVSRNKISDFMQWVEGEKSD